MMRGNENASRSRMRDEIDANYVCVFVLSIAEQLSSGATMADGDLIETWWYAVSALSFPTAPLLTATINARG